MYKAGIIFLAILSLVGCDSDKAQTPKNSPIQVDTIRVTQVEQALSVDLPGRTKAFREAEVRPQVNGIITKRIFTEGSFVKQGESLYQVDPAPYQAKLVSAKAEVEANKANLYAAETRLKRTQRLVSRGALSQQELDDTLATYKVSRAALQVSEAALNQAEINLEYTKVKAPISGLIGRSLVTEGTLVTSGQEQMLARIQQLDPINIDLSRSSAEIFKIKNAYRQGEFREESEPTITLLMGTQQYPARAKIKFTEVNVNSATDSVTIRAEFPNKEAILLPGMYVRARLNIGTDPNAILIPQKAGTRNSKGQAIVMLVDPEGTVKQKVIETAEVIGDKWRITSGLEEGDRVVISNLQRIHSGDHVEAIEQNRPKIKEVPPRRGASD